MMDETLKAELIAGLKWLDDKKGKQIKLENQLSTQKGSFDRHFSAYSSFAFVLEDFGVRASGAMAMLEGENVHFEFKSDSVVRLRRLPTLVEFELDLNDRVSQKITVEVTKE